MINTDLKTERKHKRGNPNLPKPGPGRPKGLPNKFTNLKQAFLNVFEKLGGEEELYDWAKKTEKNKAMFYQWITKMLPANLDVEHSGQILLKVSNEYLPRLEE